MTTRRTLLTGGSAGALLASLGFGTPDAAADAGDARGRTPWLRRAFQLYTGPDGVAKVRELAVPDPQQLASQWLLRRPAERVSIGAMAPDFMLDFHVANQPNILIPLFGSLRVELKDGSSFDFVHGDILFAEDCTGGGHRSGAGPEGCFSVSVQLPKTAHCLDAAADPDSVLLGRGEPKF